MSTEYPNICAHARLKATQAPQQKETTKMTDPDPPALSGDELTKILVTASKTQLEGIKTLQADTNKYFSDQLEKLSQALATSSAKSDTSDRLSKGVFQTQISFTGQPSEDLNSWLEQFRSIANLRKWSPEVQLQLLKSYLKGNASVFYQGLPADGKATFEAAVACLRANFDDSTIRNSLRIALHNRKQGINETVSQFAWELENNLLD